MSATRRTRACSIEVCLLEGRLLLSDVTAPVTTLQVVPYTLNGTGYYTSSPETVNLIASDPDSPNGLMTFYNVDNAGFVAGNSLQLVNGTHTLQFYSVDQSGNQEATQTRIFHIDSTTPIVTASANPSSLWPPNHKFVDVTVTGHVADASGGVPGTVSYRVVDEYGKVQPSGTATVLANGDYSFVVRLQSSRLGQDKDGRLYTIVVSATDEAGNTGSATTLVVVPHDQGHHGGHDHGGGNGNHGDGNHGHGNHDHGNHGHGNVNSNGGDQGQGNGNGGDHGQGNVNGNGNGKNHGHG